MQGRLEAEDFQEPQSASIFRGSNVGIQGQRTVFLEDLGSILSFLLLFCPHLVNNELFCRLVLF